MTTLVPKDNLILTKLAFVTHFSFSLSSLSLSLSLSLSQPVLSYPPSLHILYHWITHLFNQVRSSTPLSIEPNTAATFLIRDGLLDGLCDGLWFWFVVMGFVAMVVRWWLWSQIIDPWAELDLQWRWVLMEWWVYYRFFWI